MACMEPRSMFHSCIRVLFLQGSIAASQSSAGLRRGEGVVGDTQLGVWIRQHQLQDSRLSGAQRRRAGRVTVVSCSV